MTYFQHGVMVGRRTIAIERHFYRCLFKLLLAKIFNQNTNYFQFCRFNISSAILSEIFMYINHILNKLYPGAVLRWGRGAQAPQMLARPPPQYFGSNSKNTHS